MARLKDLVQLWENLTNHSRSDLLKGSIHLFSLSVNELVQLFSILKLALFQQELQTFVFYLDFFRRLKLMKIKISLQAVSRQGKEQC